MGLVIIDMKKEWNISKEPNTCIIHLKYSSGVYIDSKSEILSKIMRGASNGELVCMDCGHISRDKANMMRHVEAKHLKGYSYYCQYCNKQCPSSNALASHVSRY